LEELQEDTAAPEPLSVSQVTETPDRLTPPEAKTGPPSINDWQDFFGRFVIKGIVNGYIALQLGDMLDELTPAESKAIFLSKEDMTELAAPLATLSHKSSFMRKHGRFIISTADSYESVVTLLFWMRRVNRIASKHRKAKQPAQPIPGLANSGRNNNAESHGSDRGQGEQLNGQPVGIGVYNPGAGG
jgi:hypothetical protein